MKKTSIRIKNLYIPSIDAGKQEIYLCKLLNEYDINMSQLAKKCHVSKQTINNIINGVTKLTFPMACALGFALDLSPEEIWNELHEEDT